MTRPNRGVVSGKTKVEVCSTTITFDVGIRKGIWPVQKSTTNPLRVSWIIRVNQENGWLCSSKGIVSLSDFAAIQEVVDKDMLDLELKPRDAVDHS